MDIYDIYKKYATQYGLVKNDIDDLWNIIGNIAKHPEFLKRCIKPFFHHDTKTLGEHILSDTILTYKISKKMNGRKEKVNIRIATIIAMFHDLYEIPWQNVRCKKKTINKHGFVHPIEAIINAMTWFPEYFLNPKEAMIITDGVIHHMYPFPVRVMSKGDAKLNNQDKFDKLPDYLKKMIVSSCKIGCIGKTCSRKSFYLEGQIMSKADKIVSIRQELRSVNGLLTLVGKKNKNLEN